MDKKAKAKLKQSKEIARLTEEFLAKGGVIEEVNPVRFGPDWATKRGMDCVEWSRMGVDLITNQTNAHGHGNGNYETRMCYFEGMNDE